MKPITHIMVALAFGEYTEGIFAYAAQLAEQFDARLLVASVINTRDVKAVRTVSAMGYEVDGAHYVEEIRKERRESVDRLVNQAGFPTERLKVVIEVGHPIESLLKLTVDYDVDAVVMGLQGRSNLEHICVGSVAEKVLRRCPVTVISYRGERTAAKLKKARDKTVAKIPYVSLTRAKQLIAGAKYSVASAADPVTAQLVTATAGQILQLKKTIAAQTDLMATQCDVSEVKLLKTFTGIGDISAIGLILEIQSVARFKTVKKLASFWGLHPVYKISGDGSGAFKMSKQGRVNPRKILYTVALSAIEHNPAIKPIYQYHLQQGKHKMDAIGICMHKILRIIYGMLKNNTAFDPKIDAANRQRSLPDMMGSPKTNKNRRFQSYDSKAPVSRRQRKKRLEREQSHSVITDTKCGISAPVPIGDIISDMLSNI